MKSYHYIALGTVGSALAIGVLWPWLFPKLILIGPFRNEKYTLGEAYEVLGAVFTLGAFVSVIITLMVQHGEALDQRQDEEVASVRSEFFQLLRAWQEIIHNTTFSHVNSQQRGRIAFETMSADLQNYLSRGSAQRAAFSIEQIPAIYDAWFKERAREPLGHYFRLLYQIVKFVDESDLTIDDKRTLMRLVRAHLSEPELNLLFWNGLSPYGPKFFSLIEKYDLLQHFSFEYGIKAEEISYYPKTYERRRKAGMIG